MTGMAGLVTRMAGGRFWLTACALAAIFVGPAGVATAEAQASPSLGSPTVTNSRTPSLSGSDDGFATLVSPLIEGICTEAPLIETQPTAQTVTAPATASFSASASTPTGCEAPTVQWYAEAPGAGSFSAIPSATGTSFTTPATMTTETGTELEAVFKNEFGEATTEVVTLTVNAPACSSAPSIETQPQNVAVTEPATATFSASASTPAHCGAPTVQWYAEKPGGSFEAINTATSDSYSTPTDAADNGIKFAAKFTNAAGSVSTNEATLTVNPAPCSAVPAIETQPANVTVTEPATATFTASASTPAHCGAPTVQWYAEKQGGSFEPINTATSDSYSTPTDTADSGIKFEAVFTNAAGKATSNEATLTVNPAPCSAKPAIETQPQSVTVTEPATATFTASASTPAHCSAPTVQWYAKDPGGSFEPINTATADSYATPTSVADSGIKFEAVFTNAAGSISTNEATLTVNPAPCSAAPSVETQPANVTVTEPATATFTASASTPAHCGAPTVQWYAEKPGGSFEPISTATSDSYATPTDTADSGVKFEAVFTNAAGKATTNQATLTVNPPPCSAVPAIETQPANATVSQPATATFTAAASTPAHCAAPAVQWYSEAPGATSFSAISGATSASYTTPATVATDSGTKYEAIFTNAAGPTTSDAATLTLNCSAPPVIEVKPSSQTVTAPATATFTASASTPANCEAPKVRWETLAPGSTIETIAGATSGSYTTPATTVAQSGTLFRVVFSNAAGETKSEIVTLTVKPPPPTVTSITPTPGPGVGGATVHIVGSGFVSPATVTIGSEANAVDVVSATEITATTAATAAGAYEVIVTDANGTSTLGPSYTYVAPPVVTMEAPATKSNDPTPSFKGTATDTTPVIVEIYKGSTATGSPYVSATAPAPGAGGAWISGATPTLPSGKYTAVAVQESSINGNPAGKSKAFPFTVDTEAPSVSLNAPAWTNNQTPSFTGSAAGAHKPVTIHVYNSEGAEVATATVAGTGGAWTSGPVSPALPNGSYTVVASQDSELAGNHTGETTPVPFTVDTVAPNVTLTSPANGSSTASTSETVRGAAGTAPGDVARVRAQLFAGSAVNEGAVAKESEVDTSGTTWAATFAGLTPGDTYTARAEQADEAGNVGKSAPVTFTVTAPAALPLAAPSGPAASFTWFPAAPHTGERVSLASSSTDATTPITAFAWDLTGTNVFATGAQVITTSFSTPGNHLVRLNVTAANGLSSTAAETIPVTAPPLALMQPFPIVRITSSDTGSGVIVHLLKVQAPLGSRITVTCKGRGCPTSSSSRTAASRKGRVAPVEFRGFERSLRAGVTLIIRVFKPGEIGKYTTFQVRNGKLPLRTDTCLGPAGVKPMACPLS